MEEMIKIDSVEQYDNLFGLETLHPQVSVIDLNKATKHPTHFTLSYGVYAIFLKQVKCGDIRYGRQTYDYQEGTVVCFAPGQVAQMEIPLAQKPRRGESFSIQTLSGAPPSDKTSGNIHSSPTSPMNPCISRKKKEKSSPTAWTRST